MALIDETIASVEFGDWLVNESELEARRAASSNVQVREAARQRQLMLGQAKKLLFEFLTLQEEMMQFARLDNPAESERPQRHFPNQVT